MMDGNALQEQMARLVYETFRRKKAGAIEQQQYTRSTVAAVRQALLVQALGAGTSSLGSQLLSATDWRRVSTVLAPLMRPFWFGVIEGLWGSDKVPNGTACLRGSFS